MASGYASDSDELFDFSCNTCRWEGSERQAVDYCRACGEYFCHKCLKQHDRMPILKYHRDKLVGKEDFKNMTKTRINQSSSVKQSRDHDLFGCHNCIKAGARKMATDYCTECAKYLCECCLIGHNSWTNHNDQLLGSADLAKIVEARKTLSRSILSPAPILRGTSRMEDKPGYSKNTQSGTGRGNVKRGVNTIDDEEGDEAWLSAEYMADTVDWRDVVKIRQTEDQHECWLAGCCCLADGGWLVVDERNEVLKRLDTNFRVIDRCDLPDFGLWAICHLPEHNMAVLSTGESQTVELISLADKMTIERSVRMNHSCYGLANSNNMLYITALASHEVFEYLLPDMDLNRRIYPWNDDGENKFSSSQYVTASNNGTRLFVTDLYKGMFILDTYFGYTIGRTDVGDARHLCSGDNDTVYVVVARPWRIIHIDRNGRTLGTVVTREMMEGLEPWSVCYDKGTASLVVTVFGSCDYVFVFHLK